MAAILNSEKAKPATSLHPLDLTSTRQRLSKNAKNCFPPDEQGFPERTAGLYVVSIYGHCTHFLYPHVLLYPLLQDPNGNKPLLLAFWAILGIVTYYCLIFNVIILHVTENCAILYFLQFYEAFSSCFIDFVCVLY